MQKHALMSHMVITCLNSQSTTPQSSPFLYAMLLSFLAFVQIHIHWTTSTMYPVENTDIFVMRWYSQSVLKETLTIPSNLVCSNMSCSWQSLAGRSSYFGLLRQIWQPLWFAMLVDNHVSLSMIYKLDQSDHYRYTKGFVKRKRSLWDLMLLRLVNL